MTLNNLFNPNYECDPKSREWFVRKWIINDLTEAIKCAKKGYIDCARDYTEQLTGILHYTKTVGDISEETDNKIYKLIRILRMKYKLY